MSLAIPRARVSSLDPLYHLRGRACQPLTSSYPPPNWQEHIARNSTLASSSPWLWRKIEVRLPRNWLSFLKRSRVERTTDVTEEATGSRCRPIHHSGTSPRCTGCTNRELYDPRCEAERKLKESILQELGGPDSSIPPELFKSPARWELLRSISDAVQDLMGRDEMACMVTIYDRRPGRFVRHLDFNHFRAIGMRRLVGGSSHVSQESPNLITFGATEYMDGALTLPGRGQPLRARFTCKELEAVDFTGCVSPVFVNSLTVFVNTHMRPEDGHTHRRRRSHRPRLPEEPILNSFVTGFPSLTHLDLSATRAGPDILDELASSPTVRLQSLSLARCVRLTGSSVRNFFDLGPCCPVHSGAEPLRATAHFRTHLPVDQELLDAMPAQAKLRSLGVSYIPGPPLSKACTTLIGTSPELVRVQPWQASLLLHSQVVRPLCTPPFQFGLPSGHPLSFSTAPTRLRVIELANVLYFPALVAVLVIAHSSEQGWPRWYVDTASGWVPGPSGASLRRDLEKDHPLRASAWTAGGREWNFYTVKSLLGREDGLYGAVSFAYQG
ncbi:hypothetical protein EDB84DRAFT_1587309 [Lactarius hengduanensis]|nr:hypothetical protein EDB84DRAFT_1587309 [Lactarius hengduanensis]